MYLVGPGGWEACVGLIWFVLLPGMGCNECTHPSCQHSLNSLGIGQCVECESGVLVLDPTSGPKWKMACNKCNVVVHFFEHAHKVQVRTIFCSYSLQTDTIRPSLVLTDDK